MNPSRALKQMKKTILLLILLSFAAITHAKEETLKWQTNFDQAKKDAKTTKKQILIFFSGSDWCLNCMKLEKRVLSSSTFFKYAKDKFIFVNADFPVKKKNRLSKEQTKINESLADQYNPKGASPVLAIIDANGKKLGTFSGYKNESTQEVIQFLNKVIGKKK